MAVSNKSDEATKRPATAGKLRDEGMRPPEGFTRTRRIGIGANVALTIALAAAFVVLVNWFASLKYVRASAATFGNYGLSDRTKTILSGLGDDVKITTAYLSSESGKDRDKYLPRLMDYCDELTRSSSKVKVTHISSEDAKQAVVASVKQTYGEESTEHAKVLKDFDSLRAELEGALQFTGGGDSLGGIPVQEGWLTSFTVYIKALADFRDDQAQLEAASKEVERLTAPGGIPKYADATSRITAALTPIKEDLTRVQKQMGDIAALADAVRKPDAGIVPALEGVATDARNILMPLVSSLGADSEAPPADSAAALSAFAAEAQTAEDAIRELMAKISALAQAQPSLQLHRNWQLGMQTVLGTMHMDAARVLDGTAKTLRELRQQVLDIVDRNDAERIKGALETLRTRALRNIEQELGAVSETFTQVAQGLAALDEPSARLLEKARGGQMFDAVIQKIADLTSRFEKLPELKLGTLGDELRGDNIVIVEANKQARVIGFDEVWPVRDQPIPSAEPEDRPRSFNGDGAISAAVLSLTSQKPFATVVLATFEVQPPPQARQFGMQPQVSSLPGEAFSTLRERLKNMNFVVKDWDLAKPGDPPPPDEGTQNIYMFLPPAPPNPPNPFMGGGQQPSREFGEAEMLRVQKVLDEGGRAIFPVTWEPPRGNPFFGQTPSQYAYDDMLRTTWGIDVDISHRLLQVRSDPRAPGKFTVTAEDFNYMRLNNFTEHPIGKPFKYSRILVGHTCPVLIDEKPPADVGIEPVLTVPANEEYLVIGFDDLRDIVEQISQHGNQGRIDYQPEYRRSKPTPVIVAASRTKNNVESRVVVYGTGFSLIDDYLGREVFRQGEGRVYTEAPPSNNADLFINALFWLQGQEKWIGAGPVAAAAIEALSEEKMVLVKGVVWLVIPVLVFVPGLYMWWARRS